MTMPFDTIAAENAAAARAIESALASLGAADREVLQLHASALVIARATDWQSRAADLYHAAVDRWIGDLVEIMALVEEAAGELGAERTRLLYVGSGRW